MIDHLTAFSVAAVVVLIVLTTLQIILGELVPKSLALQYSSQTALLTVAPMAWSLTVFSWFIVVLNGSGVAILKMLRIPYGGHRHIHSPEEIDMLLAESRDGGLLEEDEHDRLHEALQLSSRSAHELMIDRGRYFCLEDQAGSDGAIFYKKGNSSIRSPTAIEGHAFPTFADTGAYPTGLICRVAKVPPTRQASNVREGFATVKHLKGANISTISNQGSSFAICHSRCAATEEDKVTHAKDIVKRLSGALPSRSIHYRMHVEE